jgi:excisionase family DNA binding protein
MENPQQSSNVKVIPEPLLTVAEVSARLKLSRSFVYGLLQSGTISSVRIGRSRRVRPQDLETFIEKNIFSRDFDRF